MRLFKWIKKLFFKKRFTGYLPDVKDPRDYKYKVGGEVPKSIPSLHNWKPLPNQGKTNSCVGFAIARALEVLVYQVVKEETGDDYYYNVSELFSWYNARKRQGWENSNSGVYPRDALKELFDKGYLPAESMPFTNSWTYKPSAKQFRLAAMARDMLLNMKVKYYRVGYSSALKLSNKGQAVMVALPIHKSWDSKYAEDGDDHTGNYHYMVLEGTVMHNDIEYCKFANSWNKGYLYVPKTYYIKYSRDTWVLASK